jgi:hypothetical protein
MLTHFASDPDMETIMLDATVVRAHSSAGKKGDQEQAALGQSKGDFTTKIHVLTDALRNRLRVCLTGRHRHDVTQAIIPVRYNLMVKKQ